MPRAPDIESEERPGAAAPARMTDPDLPADDASGPEPDDQVRATDGGGPALWRLILRTLPYLRPHWRMAAISTVVLVLDAFVDLLSPWVLKIVIDSVVGGQPLPGVFATIPVDDSQTQIELLLMLMVLMVVLAILNNGLTTWNTVMFARIEQGMILQFRIQLFRHAQQLSMSFHDRRRSGDFMYRINYSSAAVGEVPLMVPQLAQAALTLAGMFLITYTIDPTLAVLAIGVVPVLVLTTRHYARNIEPRLVAVRAMEGESLSIIQEAMVMLRVIVSFGRQEHENRRFSEQGRQAVDARVSITLSEMLFTLAVNVTTAIGTALVLGVGAWKVIQGDITIGQFLVTLTYVGMVYGQLETIIGAASPLMAHKVNLRTAFELVDTVPDVRDDPSAMPVGRAQGRVEYQRVNFTYADRHATIKDVSFEARAGQVVAVVGPTGAGKTTLVSLLSRFYDADSGSIRIDGRDIRGITLDSLRDQFSIVLQEPLLFTASIGENIAYGDLDASPEQVIDAARAAGAHDFISALPQGYDTILGERGAMLSGGERQRIAVARAFLRDAPILILDEPTSSIDSKTEAGILEALDRLMEGRTTFMIAHRLSTVHRADLILVVDKGAIIERGTHEQLMTMGGLYRQMHDIQAGVPAATAPSPPPTP